MCVWITVGLVGEVAIGTLSSFLQVCAVTEETLYDVNVCDIYPNRKSTNGAL